MPMWLIASWRVRASVRNRPRTAEVTVTEPGFLMPRIVMHRCSHSITTKTAAGRQGLVERLGDLRRQPLLDLRTLRRRSTTRAIFERPVICCCLFGMYATCAFPLNGIRWCSHIE